MNKAIAILALIAAGEAVFFLPFVIARVFRPTFLDVFGLTNLELGIAFSIYGTVAMISYFPGGLLADRFPANKLIAVSLLSTSIGGFALLSLPPLGLLKALYAFWGVTTILLFWSALIRATREWGGELRQGVSFGLLDGGRGLVTAITGTVAVIVFAQLLPDKVETATLAEREQALKTIILSVSILTAGVGVVSWFAIGCSGKLRTQRALTFSGVKKACSLPTVWLQAAVVVCAYVGFKCTDDFSLYARDALSFNEVDAARIGTVSLWMRPIAAIGAGILADRLGTIRMTIASFGLLFLGSIVIASGVLHGGMLIPVLLTISATSAGIFALRGLYYAIMREGRIPIEYTGCAVGLVSVIGYTPDVFMGPIMGLLLDEFPGPKGHQYLFGLASTFSLFGILASIGFYRLRKHSEKFALKE